MFAVYSKSDSNSDENSDENSDVKKIAMAETIEYN